MIAGGERKTTTLNNLEFSSAYHIAVISVPRPSKRSKREKRSKPRSERFLTQSSKDVLVLFSSLLFLTYGRLGSALKIPSGSRVFVDIRGATFLDCAQTARPRVIPVKHREKAYVPRSVRKDEIFPSLRVFFLFF